jgi:hypothetical protein
MHSNHDAQALIASKLLKLFKYFERPNLFDNLLNP